MYLTTALLCVSAVLSWVVFVGFLHEPHAEKVEVLRWVNLGRASPPTGRIRVDTLTAVMLVVVNTVSALVHLYSLGYMSHDAHQPRFFAYLSLFTFAMLMLVTSDNLAADVLRLGRRGPRLLSAHRLLVHARLAPTPRPSRPSWSTASAISASRSAFSAASSSSARSTSIPSSAPRPDRPARPSTSSPGNSTR